MKVLLASGSPRRVELLKGCGFDVKVHPSGADESYGDLTNPEEIAKLLALRKAQAVRDIAEDGEYIIAADTSVVTDGMILGKPKDAADARRMLKLLSGRTHEVYTGIAVIKDGRASTACEITEVHFAELSDGMISDYIKTGEPLDKAGAYGIQHYGAALVEGINGDYFNVVGLPLNRLFRILSDDFGVRPLSWLE